MAYQKQAWTNNDSNTPLSASRLTHIENGIDALSQQLNETLSLIEKHEDYIVIDIKE